MVENKLPEQLNINTGGGNYNESIGGDYVQGDKITQISTESPFTHQQDIAWETSEIVGKISDELTRLFVGREDEQQQLDQFLSEHRSGVLIVTGGAGMGKSALLANWKQRKEKCGCFVIYHCFSYRSDSTRSVVESYRHLLRQLFCYYNIQSQQLLPNDEQGLRNKLVRLVGEHGSREGQPLVIILDGLDEAENPFDPPFPPHLPEGVFVIASARAEITEEPDYLRNWTDNTSRLHLKRLPQQAIPLWLEKKGDSLTEYAQDDSFTQELYEITDGFPLYLRFLIDELSRVQKENVRAILRQSPKGFSQYVKEQFELLAKVTENQEKIEDLFDLLSVALGALSRDDLAKLTGLTSRGLVRLPWQVTRWFSTQNNLYSFTHPLLAQEFQKLLIKEEADFTKEKLINYCSHWQEHKSLYSLRHYAEHLQEAQQLEQLYDLARDKTFAATQQEQIPGEPDLSLKVVQTALLSAADTDAPVAMAEFALLHAKRLLVETVEQETPLEVIRRGNLERALNLADLYETKLRVLWYLLIAWELKDETRFGEAQEIVEKLIKNNLPRFLGGAEYWKDNYATYLLTHVFEINQEVCVELHRKLLEHDNCCDFLCELFTKYGDFPNAIKMAKEISPEFSQILKLESIARLQKREGKAQAARLTLAKALEVSREIFPNGFWIWGMTGIAQLHAELGDLNLAEEVFNEAIEIAQKIESQEDRVKTLISILDSPVDIALVSVAFKTLRQVQVDDQSKLDKCWKVKLLKTTAKLEAKSGYLEKAKITFDSALELAQCIENQKRKADVLVDLVTAQTEIKEFVSALKTAQKIQDKSKQGEALSTIVTKYIESNNFTNSLISTDIIEDQFYKYKALELIALKQVELEDYDGAIETAERTGNKQLKDSMQKLLRNRTIVAIARKQAERVLTKNDLVILKSNFSKVNDDESHKNILSALSEAHARMGDFDSALKIADSLDTRIHTRLSIAKIQVDAHQTREARDTIAQELKPKHEFEFSYIHSFFLIAVAESQLEAGEKEIAVINAKRAYEIAKNINNKPQQIHSLALISWVLAKAEDQETVLKVLAFARESANGMKKGSDDRIDCFTKIGVAQVRAGEFDAALETLKKIELPYGQAIVLKNLAYTYKSTEQRKIIKEAIEYVYENIKTRSAINVVRSQCDFAIALVEIGDKEAGLNFLNNFCNQAEEQKNRSQVLSQVAIAEARVGEITRAWQKTTRIEDGWEQLVALEAIAWIQLREKDREGLFRTLDAAKRAKEKIQREQDQARARKVIARLQAMVGGRESDKVIATAKSTPTGTELPLSIIADIFANKGEKYNFKQLLIPCAHSFDTTYEVCRNLASLYPEKVQDIVKVVNESCQSAPY